MKKIILTNCFVIVFVSIYASETFYYSNQQKNIVEIDTTKLNVLFYPNSIDDSISALLSNTSKLAIPNRNLLKLYEVSEIKDVKFEFDILKRNTNVAYVWYKIRTDKNITLIPTNEILFELNEGFTLDKITSLFKQDKIKIKSVNKYGVVVAEVSECMDLFNYANQIYETGYVKYCHPNFWTESFLCSNDTYYNDQYYLKNTGQFGGTAGIDINAEGAWSITNGSSNIKIAVLDNGFENHEDLLSSNIITGFTPSGFGGTTGLPVCCPDLKNGHGQCVAGIIGAIKDNNTGVAGIAPLCKMTSVNIVTGYETQIQMADGINWAWNNASSDILSMQFSTQSSDAITNAITNAITLGRNGKGCVVVAGSGNGYSNSGFFPSNVNNVITVGAINKNGNIWTYSNTGSSMDLVAPSGDIGNGLTGDLRTIDRMGNLGYYTTNYTSTFGGTSAAAPQVSGVAALMLSVNPNLTETQVRTVLQQTAVDMGAAGFDNTFGYGRLNACAAVAKAMEMAGGSPVTISGANGICGTTQTYIANAPPGYTVTWNVTPLGIVNQAINGNSITLTKIGNPSVVITLTATLNICNSTLIKNKSITLGLPYTQYSVNGCGFQEAIMETAPDDGPCNVQCYNPGGPNKTWCVPTAYNATGVSWTKILSFPANYSFWSANNNDISLFFKAANQSIELKRTITNVCGSIDQYYCFGSNTTYARV
ncbi:MAG: S8 family serine peptidase [Chitinophagales bacterium]